MSRIASPSPRPSPCCRVLACRAPARLLSPFAARAAARRPTPWHVVGLPQQTKPLHPCSRSSRSTACGPCRIEADESYGNLVHPVSFSGSSRRTSPGNGASEKQLENADLRTPRRRRHGGQGLRLLRPADGQHSRSPIARSCASARSQDERLGAGGDGLLCLGREASRPVRRSTTPSRGACATSSCAVGNRAGCDQLDRRAARRRRRFHQAVRTTSSNGVPPIIAVRRAPTRTTPHTQSLAYVGTRRLPVICGRRRHASGGGRSACRRCALRWLAVRRGSPRRSGRSARGSAADHSPGIAPDDPGRGTDSDLAHQKATAKGRPSATGRLSCASGGVRRDRERAGVRRDPLRRRD